MSAEGFGVVPAREVNPAPVPAATSPFELELVSALARQDCVIVVGSGVSAASTDEAGNRPPTWEALLREASAGLPAATLATLDNLYAQKDYLTAAELVLTLKKAPAFYPILERHFAHRRYNPNANHVHLAALAQRVYMTPNFDTILDVYMRSEFTEGVSIKHQGQNDILPWLRNANVLVIKNHGTIDIRDTIVLTRSQYAQQRVLNAAFFRVIDALFLTKTVLFVGCGTSDPDFQLMLEDAALSFPGAPHHYMIKLYEAENALVDQATEGLRNLKMVYYHGGHENLPNLLEQLVLEVTSLRAVLP